LIVRNNCGDVMKARYLHTHEAASVDADISRENQTATLHFLAVDGDAYAMTIPLFELRRLHENISAQLDAEPMLIVPKIRDQS